MAWVPATVEGEVEGPTLVRIGTRQILLVPVDGAIYATEAHCPHKFGPLEEGHVEDGCLVCPLHDAHFRLDTGKPRKGDEWAGRLATYACRLRDGVVEVDEEALHATS